MKSGTGDDPFADDGDEAEESSPSPLEQDSVSEESQATTTQARNTADTSNDVTEIPYKFRRDSVKEGRKQRPIFLRSHIEERENEFLRELEDELGEDVYKTDALEAAIAVAMDNPHLVADRLREWGYDWE